MIPPGPAVTRSRPLCGDLVPFEPDIELSGVEAHETADLEEGDPAFRHQPAYMARCDAKRLRDSIRVEQRSPTC